MKTRRVEDYCLVANRWLELDWRQQDFGDDSDQKTAWALQELKVAINLAQAKNLSKIEILLPANATGLRMALKRMAFQPALTELKLKLADFVQPAIDQPALSLSSLCPSKLTLKMIMLEQINFHHQALPDYYLSVGKIDWKNYLQQVKTDAQKEGGLLLLAKEEALISALILGEVKNKRADIWELIVADGRRQNHLGTFLLSEYIQRLGKLGVEELCLETLTNSYAKTWYEKLGFKIIGQSYFLSLK